MEQFKIIGYYLCEITDTPKWLSGIGRRMLSVSTCLGEQHPRQECFLGRWRKGESEKYRKKLKIRCSVFLLQNLPGSPLPCGKRRRAFGTF